MTPVSLSIVFGPGVFHCGGGLEGMKLQGYANSVLCRLVMYSDALFQVQYWEGEGGQERGRKGEKRLEKGRETGEGKRGRENYRKWEGGREGGSYSVVYLYDFHVIDITRYSCKSY